MVEPLLAYQEGLCCVEAVMHVDWIHMAHDCVKLQSVTMCRAVNLKIPVYMKWSSPKTQLSTQQKQTSTAHKQ